MFQGIKISTRGIIPVEAEVSARSIQQLQPKQQQVKSTEKLVKNIEKKKKQNCAVQLLGGKLILDQCVVSLAQSQSDMPGIVCHKAQYLHIKNSLIKGNNELSTIGVISRYTKVKIEKSKIKNHRGGGIFLYQGQEEAIIDKCEIFNNLIFGVLCSGKDSTPQILNSVIESNDGSGIKISQDCKAMVYQCEIIHNETGIEVENCDPIIEKNNIHHNFGDGIKVIAEDDFKCQGTIKDNILLENTNGIAVIGEYCTPLIQSNTKICHNRKSGIRVSEKAFPTIKQNSIFENLNQGILCVETASAIIEENKVYSNIRANIAYGGKASKETVISSNEIYKGKCEGIFVFEGGLS